MTGIGPGETLRVLLVSTDEGMWEQVQAMLPAIIRDCRVYWVAQPDLAGTRAVDLIPHIILVDDELGNAKPATLVAQLTQRAPRAAILALVGPRSLNTAQAAVLAGARAFVVKPLNRDDLLASVRQVLAQRGASIREEEPLPPQTGRIIAFCAPKGGTGRTTLTINTAIGLQHLTKKMAVLVDADYATPAVDVALNLDSSRSIVDLLPVLNELDADLINSVLASHASGIRVLLAPADIDARCVITLPQVQQVLAWLKRLFPWVVIDLGLPLDETSFAFLDGADRIVMSVLPEMVGLRNTRLMLDQLADRGYSPDRIWLVLNRADLKGGVPVADIEDRLKVRVRFKVPDDQPLATYSVNRGVPLAVSHADSRIGKALRVLVEELAREVGPVPAPSEPRLLGRLFNRQAVPDLAG